jgi:hypothetical protein
MSREWGRESYAGDWPSRKPVGLILALAVAVASAVGIETLRYKYQWTFTQRFYLARYIQTGLAGTLRKQGYYMMLAVVDRRGLHRIAFADELAPATFRNGERGERLTRAALSRGAVRLEWERGYYDNVQLHAQIRQWVFENESWWDLAHRACYGGLIIFVLGVIVAIPGERKRMHVLKHGRRLRGPELVTASEFNRRNRADGVGFINQERTLGEKIFGQGRMVRVPREEKSFHILVMGDTGMGKSALIRQVLMQVEDRDEAAIVYDPALEYTRQFYRPERRDTILNPLDQRMPYRKPGDEVRHDAEALTLAASLYPDVPGKDRFFTRGPREVFAHLLSFKPGPEELAHWMCHDEEIQRRVRGTEMASTLAEAAPEQREGVLAELKMVGRIFRLLPSELQTKRRWTTREWAKERKGWLFLTTTPETRERLAPLVSLWLDTLVLRLINQGQPGPRPAWFVVDELASLQKLPQLHTAITENPVVLGFQGRKQMEENYGPIAETMLSMPGTKIFLRTSEPRSAKWISEAIGEIEVERLRESRTDGYRNRGEGKSYTLDRHIEPLVMASEITGLKKRRGHLKSGNLVVRLSFPYIELPKKQPAFIERLIPESPKVLAEELPSRASTSSDGGAAKHVEKPEHELEQKVKRAAAGKGRKAFFE